MLLVERDAALDQLQSGIAAARTGAGSLVAVSGEAGAGKTALVREALSAVPALWGYCEPLSTPRPLGPFRDLAGQLWPRSVARSVARSGGVDLRERLLDWLRGQPVPLVIEDAHWIDEASADLLRFLGRRVGSCAGLIVLTFRDDLPAEHPLRRVLGELSPGAAVTRIEVRPLSPAGVARLVADTPLDAAEVYRLTQGNAFLVSQLVLAPDDQLARPVRDAVVARVAQLPPAARAVIELTSVVPGRVSAALLGADWVQLDAPGVAGLLRVDGAIVEFRHELVRLAVERDLQPGHRRDLHAEVLRRLAAAEDTEPAVVAFHARRAHDGALALSSELVAAARAVALGSHREAAAHYRRALADATQPGRAEAPDPAALVGMWLALSGEELLIGRDGAALDAAQAALALCPPGADPLVRGIALRRLSRVVKAEAQAQELAQSAVEVLEPLGRSAALAAAYAQVATNRMVARDLGAAAEWARRAIELAIEVDDVESHVAGLQALGCALTLSGTDPECRHLQRAVDLAREAGLDGELGRAHSNLVSAAGEARLYARSSTAFNEALPYFVAQDLDGHASYTRAWHARCRFEQGQWADATTLVDEVLSGRVDVTSIAALAAWCVRGRIRARRGDPEVWAALAEAKRLADRTGSLQRTAPVAAARAEAHWLAGEPDDGESGLRAAYELALERTNPWAIGELGLWMWRHGLLARLPDTAAEPYRCHVGGDAVAAGHAWSAIGCPYEAANAWCDTADEESVRAALEIFLALGSGPGRQRATRRLRGLGVRSIPRGPRSSTASDPDGLTAREQDVLERLRAGDTDAEIAAGLYLSVKTVGHHVSSVLRKTGSRSRRDLQAPRG